MVTMTKSKVEVNDLEIENIFRELENQIPSPFISFTLLTDFTDMVLKCKEDGSINPYYKQIKKKTDKTFRLVTNYKQRVWNNRTKEGKCPEDFVPEEPKGKVHISKCLLTDTKTQTKRYVMIEWFPENKGTTEYFHGTDPIGKDMFEKWITYYDTSNEKQGLDREVKPITPSFESIVSFRVNGVEYIRKN